MLRRCISAEAAFFLPLWLGLLLVGRTALFRDPGTFWHVALGQQILRTGQVPWTDAFSFTFDGRPSIADQWLAEAAMAAVHRLAGWDGLLLVTATALAGVYAWLAARLVRSGLHWLPAVLLLGLVLLASSHNFHARPLVATIALEAVVFALLLDVESGRAGLNRLWWLVPLSVVWANLHGGVLGGLGTIALAAAGWCLAWRAGFPSPVRSGRDAITLCLASSACWLSVLVNPYGLALPREWIATLSLPLPDLIQEHRPLRLSEVYGWTAAIVLAIYLAVVAGALSGRGGPAERDADRSGEPVPRGLRRLRVAWLLPLVWFALSCQRVRNLPLFAVTAALALADVLPHSRAAAWLASRGLFRRTTAPARQRRLERHAVAFLLPAVLVTVAAASQIAGLRVPVVGRDWVRFDPARWPQEEVTSALREIDEQAPDGTPIFNDLDLGGFVIYYAPRLRVFIDDRCALYGGQFLEAYNHARLDDPGQLDRWHAQYRFPYALVQSGTKFDRHLRASEEWRLVARDRAAALYRRAD